MLVKNQNSIPNQRMECKVSLPPTGRSRFTPERRAERAEQCGTDRVLNNGESLYIQGGQCLIFDPTKTQEQLEAEQIAEDPYGLTAQLNHCGFYADEEWGDEEWYDDEEIFTCKPSGDFDTAASLDNFGNDLESQKILAAAYEEYIEPDDSSQVNLTDVFTAANLESFSDAPELNPSSVAIAPVAPQTSSPSAPAMSV